MAVSGHSRAAHQNSADQPNGQPLGYLTTGSVAQSVCRAYCLSDAFIIDDRRTARHLLPCESVVNDAQHGRSSITLCDGVHRLSGRVGGAPLERLYGNVKGKEYKAAEERHEDARLLRLLTDQQDPS
eukprot:7379608-Prymnesium_polylepis.4